MSTPLGGDGVPGETRLLPVARLAGQSPSLYWMTETVFELKDLSQAENVSILLMACGQGRVLSVDVWEASGP